MRSPVEERARNGRMATKVRGMIRRLTASTTDGLLWKLLGFEDADGNRETTNVEIFQNAGFASRPADPSRAEAIVVKVGGESGHPVVVATRDADAAKRLLEGEGLAAGETVIFASGAMVKIKADGTIEIGSSDGSGTFEPLALKSDVQRVVSALLDSATLANDGGGTYKTNITASINGVTPPNADGPAPVGTTKLKAE